MIRKFGLSFLMLLAMATVANAQSNSSMVTIGGFSGSVFGSYTWSQSATEASAIALAIEDTQPQVDIFTSWFDSMGVNYELSYSLPVIVWPDWSHCEVQIFAFIVTDQAIPGLPPGPN